MAANSDSKVATQKAVKTALAGKQANLDLVKGTLTNGKYCTYNSTGTLLDCNSEGGASWTPTEVDGHAAASPSAANLLGGATIYNYGQGEEDVNITLPATAANLAFIASAGTAQAANYWRFTAAAAGTMYLDGSATGKDYVQFSAPAVGDELYCYTWKTGVSAYSWKCRTIQGTSSTN